jgi:hypothetical protein
MPKINKAGSLKLSHHTTKAVACWAILALLTPSVLSPAWAAKKHPNAQPSGTLLIPISPKLDYSQPAARKENVTPAATPAEPVAAVQEQANQQSAAADAGAESKDNVIQETAEETESPSQWTTQNSNSADKISAEQGPEDLESGDVGEDTTLKGTIQLVADDTEYDQEKNTFLGTGNAVVIINGENSKLEADTVLYDQNNQIIDARGNVRINRSGQISTGSAFKFKVTSDEYLITNPDTEISGTTIIARKGHGSRNGLVFTNGTMQMPAPIHISNNLGYGPGLQDAMDKMQHPEAFIPSTPSYKFTARKMTYERYKEDGNLTVFGGKVRFGNFNMPIPVPKFTMTVGQSNRRVVFPVTPLITNNLQMGGTSIGPNFNFSEGKTGVFSVAPLVQFGGTTGTDDKSSIGAGARIGFRNAKISSHFAYGSVSKLAVADFKYQFAPNLKFQSGLNRFLEDGIFGVRRAHLIGEVVHTHSIGNIPFIASLSFRSAAGWMQDTPDLLNRTPDFAKLFTPTTASKITASRIQEQITAISHPLFALGDDKVGAKFLLYGGVGLKGYSTGDFLGLGQFGPILDVKLNRVRFQTGYTQSGTTGRSPFQFDQFIQGTRSTYLSGDVKLSKWLTVGGIAGYNLDSKLLYQKTISAAIGPEDFKLLISRDMIRGISRYGFDVILGAPIPFNKLVLKGSPDQGQFGGI